MKGKRIIIRSTLYQSLGVRRVTALPRIIGPLIFAASPPRGPPADTSSRSTRAATPPRDYRRLLLLLLLPLLLPQHRCRTASENRREKTFPPKTRKPADYITAAAGASARRNGNTYKCILYIMRCEKFILLLCTRNTMHRSTT